MWFTILCIRSSRPFPPIFSQLNAVEIRLWKEKRDLISLKNTYSNRTHERRELYSSQKLGSYLRPLEGESEEGRVRNIQVNRALDSFTTVFFFERRRNIFKLKYRIDEFFYLKLRVKKSRGKIDKWVTRCSKMKCFSNSIVLSIVFFFLSKISHLFAKPVWECQGHIYAMMQFF